MVEHAVKSVDPHMHVYAIRTCTTVCTYGIYWYLPTINELVWHEKKQKGRHIDGETDRQAEILTAEKLKKNMTWCVSMEPEYIDCFTSRRKLYLSYMLYRYI